MKEFKKKGKVLSKGTQLVHGRINPGPEIQQDLNLSLTVSKTWGFLVFCLFFKLNQRLKE